MAAPTIKFKRGLQANLPALAAGEPAFVSDEYNFYVGLDGNANTNKFFGSSRYWVKEATSTGQSVKLHAKTGAGGGGSVSIKSPDTSAVDTTYTLPAAPTANYFLKTDANGVTTWAEVVSTLNIAADTGTADVVNTGETITFTGGEGIDTTVSNNVITIAAELATSANAGVATFSATDFLVTAGNVTLVHEAVQDIVGAMVDANSESGISVTYDDPNHKLDFNVADFTVTLSGDLSGSVTITDLASGTLTATIVANSVALGTDTTGQYASTISGGSGLTATAAGADDATAYTITVGAGEGIIVNADDVALKNGTNLVNNTIIGWDDTNGQLVNSPVTYSGNDVAVAGDLTITGNDIKSSGGTTALTLSGANVTVAGNLTVSGTTTTINSTITTFDDPVLELGLVSGSAPVAATSNDLGFRFHYYQSTAKTSSIYWDGNSGFVFVANTTEGNGPQLSGALADIQAKGLWLGDFGTPANQVLKNNSGIFELINTLVDGGTF